MLLLQKGVWVAQTRTSASGKTSQKPVVLSSGDLEAKESVLVLFLLASPKDYRKESNWHKNECIFGINIRGVDMVERKWILESKDAALCPLVFGGP